MVVRSQGGSGSSREVGVVRYKRATGRIFVEGTIPPFFDFMHYQNPDCDTVATRSKMVPLRETG